MKITSYLSASLLFVFVLSGNAIAATNYGSFTLETGKGYILRDAQKIDAKLNTNLEILDNDLIRLMDDSSGKLISNEKATVDLGSNAVLKVKSWQEESSRGFISLLYGKIKATISGLNPAESFNIKTANSVIGVKGTEYSAGVNADGDSYAWALEEYVYLTDAFRRNQMIVPTGYYAANFKDSGLQRMVYVGESASLQDIKSNLPSVAATKTAGTDKFFAKRADLGPIPVLDLGTPTDVTAPLVKAKNDLQKDSLVPINLGTISFN